MTKLLPLSLLVLLFFSCRKEGFITSPDARVSLSADTLHFDTVFTTAGSVTQFFMVKNENDRKLLISSIRVMGGAGSVYHINADGTPGPEINDLELGANDSTYVFVNLSINPSAGALPFVVRDSVRIAYNGTEQFVQLEAWGQNAHFFRNKVISSTETWTNDLPYVILGSLQVSNTGSLTIEKGCRVFVHADAPLIIDGTLRVNGEKDSIDRVYFRGDRLDLPYADFPASWPGIFFTSTSRDNQFQYAVIKNAYQAIALQDPSVSANPKLILNECIIENAYDAGILALNSAVQARNCLVSNCGKNLVLVKGGQHLFEHCTIASYSNTYLIHKDPVLLLTNFVAVNNVPVTADLNATFRNCIFWGDNGTVENEVAVLKSGTGPFSVTFDHNLWKQTQEPSGINSISNLNNQAPMFDSINTSKNYYDFRLKAGSPLLDKGVSSSVLIDLDGKSRPVGLPDLGCYEKH